MEIVEVGWDDERVRDLVALRSAIACVDSPWELPVTEHRQRMQMRYGWDLEPSRALLAYEGETPVAFGEYATSEWDNLDAAFCYLGVDPAARGRGLGTLMLGRLTGLAEEERRTNLCFEGWDLDAGRAFAERRGFRPVLASVNRRWHAADQDPDALRRHRDDAAASAYELIGLEGRTPADLLPALAELSASINDAPLDDLEIEDEVYPPERVAAYETAQLSAGFRFRRVVARHRVSGDLAGHTVVVVDEEAPTIGHQHDTCVARAHRGHRLGLRLKAEMIGWLAQVEPQLETVDTWNAESNAHMIAVNEALGYRWMGRAYEYQQKRRAPT